MANRKLLVLLFCVNVVLCGISVYAIVLAEESSVGVVSVRLYASERILEKGMEIKDLKKDVLEIQNVLYNMVPLSRSSENQWFALSRKIDDLEMKILNIELDLRLRKILQ